MTPLEKARKRQSEVMCCLECENVEKVGGAWYCKISGKMQYPYRLVNTGVPMKCDNAKKRMDGEPDDDSC